jgi:sugar phosphate isomerase/epimerase
MNLSFTTLSVQDKTLREAITIARNYKLEGIELRGKDNCHISPRSSRAYIESAKEMIHGEGLTIPCLTAYTKFFQHTKEAAVAQAYELAPMLELAAEIGAATVRTFMGPVPEGMERSEAENIAAEGLNQAAEMAKRLPVRIVIETHDSVKSGAVLAPLLKKLPVTIGVLLDIIHPWDAGENITTTLSIIGERIYHVHIKDIFDTLHNGRIYSPIGQGKLDVINTVKALLDFGYQNFFSLEWEKSVPGQGGVDFEEQMESFVYCMRNIFPGGNQ